MVARADIPRDRRVEDCDVPDALHAWVQGEPDDRVARRIVASLPLEVVAEIRAISMADVLELAR